MAAARTLALAPDGCLPDHSANHTANTHTTGNPNRNRPLSPPSRISRRLPASSSFVLAAARLRALQLDPWPRGETAPGTCEEIQKNSQLSPAARVVTGPGSYVLLTVVALMGAADRLRGGEHSGGISGCPRTRWPRPPLELGRAFQPPATATARGHCRCGS